MQDAKNIIHLLERSRNPASLYLNRYSASIISTPQKSEAIKTKSEKYNYCSFQLWIPIDFQNHSKDDIYDEHKRCTTFYSTNLLVSPIIFRKEVSTTACARTSVQ